MKIYDAHVHLGLLPDPAVHTREDFVRRMEEAGVYGCALFSEQPKQTPSYEERITRLFAWTSGLEDRIFPVLWIDPFEKDAIQKAKDAAERGVCAFKIICDCYHVYERKCLSLLETIAALGKPVFFHSGILWNGGVSSRYNRPLDWEALLDIPDLRFSMGHCAWPWYDECIALYGKFLNAYTSGSTSAEMFFDLTPGTPVIYRRDLLYKLFYVGYDVPHNLLFGTDASAEDYKPSWVSKWIEADDSIYHDIGVGEEIRRLIYSDNLRRFLGRQKKDFKHQSPVPDNAEVWSLPFSKK